MAIKWKIFEKTGGGGKYGRYANRVVVITTDRGLMFPPATTELLGSPAGVLLLHDGNGHIGIKPVKEDDPEIDNAFTISYSKKEESKACAVVNCKAFIREYRINPKIVYSTITVENNIMVIDTTKLEVLKLNN